jgi:hypothetical protein
MSAKDTLENMARNTWLAGLGSINSSKEALAKSIDAAQEKSNELYSELLTRGEEIQNKISHKKDEIQAKGKQLFASDSQDSQEEKLAQLNAAVDDLTSIVVKLIEKRSAEASSSAKMAPKAVPKPAAKATSKAAPKAPAKATSKAVPKAPAKATSKAVPKAPVKATSKAVPKAPVKATSKAVPKTPAKATSKAVPKVAAKPKLKATTTTKSAASTNKDTKSETPATPQKDA